MAIGKYRKLIVPFLMGQRRDGLCRIGEIDADDWGTLQVPGFEETRVTDPNEQLRRMGGIYSRLSNAISGIAGEGVVPVCVAGDCVSSLGVLAGLERAAKRPQRILWLDAHGDFHTWGTTHTRYIGGMALALLVGRADRRRGDRDVVSPFRDAIGCDPYPEERIILSDARDLDPGEKEALRASRVAKCSIADIPSHLEPDQSLYLHWDTDVLDAEAEMPALKYHVKRGPSRAEIGELFRSLRKANIVAVSVSAWHEEKDIDNRTATAFLQLLQELGLGMGGS